MREIAGEGKTHTYLSVNAHLVLLECSAAVGSSVRCSSQENGECTTMVRFVDWRWQLIGDTPLPKI